MAADGYIEFIEKIKQKHGIDLAQYKETQMKRRLTSLRNKRGFHDFNQYFQAMNKDQFMLKEFTDRITINVSEFYRNGKRWEILKNQILPSIIGDKKKISIWSAACSTGEEPYSIALMGEEHFSNVTFDILATDMDQTVLSKAKDAVYQEQALKELPPSMKKDYFTENTGLYHLDPKIKRQVTFRKHNLLKDTYPKNIDLIICRNVLIYFTDQAKALIYQNFHNALQTNGMLFVGSTEQIFTPERYGLKLADTFFYQKK